MVRMKEAKRPATSTCTHRTLCYTNRISDPREPVGPYVTANFSKVGRGRDIFGPLTNR
jgi:hypothetical protein